MEIPAGKTFADLLWEEDDYEELPNPKPVGRPRKYPKDHARMNIRMPHDMLAKLDAKRPSKVSREDYVRELIARDINDDTTA